MRLAPAALRGPAASRWSREEAREREERLADILRAQDQIAQTRERIRLRMADERAERERQTRRQRSREAHERRMSRIKGDSSA